MNKDKFTAESREPQQILIISKENILAKYITQLAILNHLLKYSFIHEFIKKIQFSHHNSSEIFSSQSSIDDS